MDLRFAPVFRSVRATKPQFLLPYITVLIRGRVVLDFKTENRKRKFYSIGMKKYRYQMFRGIELERISARTAGKMESHPSQCDVPGQETERSECSR
jgi:hypothetical protein